GYRIEEMHADDSVGTPGESCDFCNRNGRGVGGENHFRAADTVEITKDLCLDLKFLCRGFNDEITTAEFFTVKYTSNARHRLVRLLRREFVLCYLALEVPANGFYSTIEKALLNLAQDHMIAILREDMGNTVAHGSSANHPNCLYVHAYLDKTGAAQSNVVLSSTKLKSVSEQNRGGFGRAGGVPHLSQRLLTD